MPNELSYRSFCWCLGTTSFRTKRFNQSIEQQLALLHEFWGQEENARAAWSGNNRLQEDYYRFMKARGFVEGEAPRKDKDAREKTSGLVDIGLISPERRLTRAGLALLAISQGGDFAPDNFLQIPRDSFLYLKQLLKTSVEVDGGTVRPFLVLLHLLKRLGTLSLEEFTYLLPLCTDPASTRQVLEGILALRRGEGPSVNEMILRRLMSMDNYQAAAQLLLSGPVDEELICAVGMNRKSRRYDRGYYPLYRALHRAYLEGDEDAFAEVYTAAGGIQLKTMWRNYLFGRASEQKVRNEPRNCLCPTEFDHAASEQAFRLAFFRTMHLFKARATLRDYCDLNRRYIRTTDVVLFGDGQVKLDIVPRHFFDGADEALYALAYIPARDLFEDCPLEEISPSLAADEGRILADINRELGTHAHTADQLREILDDARYERLARLIEERFSDQQLLQLLDWFEERRDEEICDLVTDNADVPTIFEYVLGILWYKVSQRQGRVLDYMKLSLDADLLPRSHAVGGEADIVYEYSGTEDYPAHTLLLEATLADRTNQRRMEMEPVSRHLGQHLLRTGNDASYGIFVTPYLDLNVLSDFRARLHTPFYEARDRDGWDRARWVPGMRIVPLQTAELKRLLQSHMTYAQLYPLLARACGVDLPPHQWYRQCIQGIWAPGRP